MTKLFDIFPESLFQECVEKGLVRRTVHPTKPYTILNYTEQCQYSAGNWNAVTLACRGLIFNHLTMEVIARPFKKFFNYGDSANTTHINVNEAVIVTNKMDGSLGVLYDGDCIATRGSFDSDQALHATELFRRKYAKDFIGIEGWTFLFEIIYPENRIVLDYENMDDLILLGAVENATGNSRGTDIFFEVWWYGPRTKTFPYSTLKEALEAPNRQNAEGLVVHFLDSNERLKIKQEDYVRLHKIISGLNERAVWEHLSEGKSVESLLDGVPDEFHDWVIKVASRLKATVDAGACEVETAYSTILDTLPREFTKKDFAMVAKDHVRRAELFARHDGKTYLPKLWKDVYPEAGNNPRATLDNPDTIV